MSNIYPGDRVRLLHYLYKHKVVAQLWDIETYGNVGLEDVNLLKNSYINMYVWYSNKQCLRCKPLFYKRVLHLLALS